MIQQIYLILCISCVFISGVYASDFDGKLGLIKKVYKLEAKACTSLSDQHVNELEYEAGKALFESTALSGNRDISCSTCHLKEFGFADGLPIAIGVGGQGKGAERYGNGKGTLVQRNTFTLKGRGSSQFKAFFWDGKVQVEGNNIVTQFGDHVNGFSNPLSAAAILPIIERDEFLGETSFLVSNDIQHEVRNKLYYERYLAISRALKNRLLTSDDPIDKILIDKVSSAGVDVKNLELRDIGNLLSTFITKEFSCDESGWDRYLSGDSAALTISQKKGAILFYGKGRCASCHDGSLLTDFEYHSIGSPQGGFGPHSRHRDIGRAGVTNRHEDLYKFRTPPLIGVKETKPYGHSGAFNTLREITIHHINPMDFYFNKKDYYKTDYYLIGKLLGSRSNILSTIDIKNEEEIGQIVDFLEAL